MQASECLKFIARHLPHDCENLKLLYKKKKSSDGSSVLYLQVHQYYITIYLKLKLYVHKIMFSQSHFISSWVVHELVYKSKTHPSSKSCL